MIPSIFIEVTRPLWETLYWGRTEGGSCLYSTSWRSQNEHRDLFDIVKFGYLVDMPLAQKYFDEAGELDK